MNIKPIHWLLSLTACLPMLFLWPLPLAANASLVPAPSSVVQREGSFTLMTGSRLAATPGSEESARWIAALLEEHVGLQLTVDSNAGEEAAVRLRQVGTRPLEQRFIHAGLARPARLEEAYALLIGNEGIEILAASPEGMFYGLATLWQLVLSHGVNIPYQEILDSSEFSWRGLMLDSARHMQSVEFIKQYLDWMALHKMNVFHWHLTDDQAWRIEIKAYPRLTEVGAFRVPAGDAPAADIDPATGMPRLYGGYYSHAEIRDVVAHAASRFITVVPEIDVPGHATAAIAAYPELGVEGHKVDRVSASWGIFPNAFNLEESTLVFLENVLAEVVELFPGPFIHLGGDEVETEQWEHSARVQARMKQLGIKDIQSLQNYYVERLQTYLDRHQRRVIGWDEILQSELPPHAAVMSWRGVEGAIEAAAKGHQTVLSPAPTLYLDHLQTAEKGAPPGRGGVITTRDIYQFDPLPDSLADNSDLLLGIQGNLWTEHVRTEARVAYMTWPRAAAIAELGWSQPQRRDWVSFSERLPKTLERLQKLGIPAATDAHALYGVEPTRPPDGNPARREDRELQLCTQAIVLALEDDAPIEGERASFLVDIQNPCWIWPDVNLSSFDSVRAAVGQLPFNFEIGESISHVVVEKPSEGYGALRVRLGACDGELIAELPLEPAVDNHAVTELPAAVLSLPDSAPDRADLCFSFTRPGIEPIWAVDWIQLENHSK